MNFLLGLITNDDVEGMLRGYLAEKLRGVTVGELHDWVRNNRSLLALIGDGGLDMVRKLNAMRPGVAELFTRERLLGLLRQELPMAVGFFENWEEAGAWLDRQLADIQAKIGSPRS